MVWLPRELFDSIVKGVSPHSTKSAADALLFDEGYENLLWRAIFRKDDWIDRAHTLGANPALICPNLKSMSRSGTNQCYVLLVTHDYGGDLRFNCELLFKSLRRGYKYDKATDTVKFPKMKFETKSGRRTEFPAITLNIREPLKGEEIATLPKNTIRSLFEEETIRTQYSFAHDKEIRSLESSEIFGLGGTLSSSTSEIPICVLYLEEKRPVTLQEIGRPGVKPIFTGRKLVGWKPGEL